MKGKGLRKLKQMISVVTSLAKSKCTAIRNTSDAMKARLMVTSLTLLSKKEKVKAISSKIHNAIDGILSNKDHSTSNKDDDDREEYFSNNAIVLYNNKSTDIECVNGYGIMANDDDDDKYPDLTHSLFDEEDEIVDLLNETNASVIDMVKNSKEDKENFNLEDEIDEAADMFISKFHKRMRLQKLLSFKRYQQMLERGSA